MSEEWSAPAATPVRYVRWYWPDDDVWAYDELDAEGWCLRHVEVRANDGRTLAAASRLEVLAVWDSGGASAVVTYESKYGVVPEGQIPPDAEGYSVAPIEAAEFERLWAVGRVDREAMARGSD